MTGRTKHCRQWRNYPQQTLQPRLPMQRYFRDAHLYTFTPLTDDMIRNYIGEKHLHLPRSY